MYKTLQRLFVPALVAAVSVGGQELKFESDSDDEPLVFDARLSIGFNYDLLRPPTSVSFEYPKGYFGLNVPIQQSVNPLEMATLYGGGMDSLFSDSGVFTEGAEFEPRATAAQSPNHTIRVDVPVMGGVATFSNIENVNLTYLNTLGIPSLRTDTTMEEEGVSMLLRGAISVPMDIIAKWETMTFGYAYRVNRNFRFAFHLNRHLFHARLRAKVNVDMLGYADVDQEQISLRIPLSYSLEGAATADYLAEAWSPTIAVDYWRFGLTSRFGVNTTAKGHLKARYALPFFVDPERFTSNMTGDMFSDADFINQLQDNDTSFFEYGTEEKMKWTLPSGHTFSFDVFPKHLTLSYTKMLGSVEMELDNVWRLKRDPEDSADTGEEIGRLDSTGDYRILDFSAGIPVDNVIMLGGSFRRAFFNLGIFTLDMDWGDQREILSSALSDAGYPLLGGAPIMPVLNVGSSLGTKIQLLVELDLLPFQAVKSGVYYYF